MAYITKKQILQLREIARIATMDTASFGFSQEKFHAPLETFGPVSLTTPDEFIKERTKTWRETWVVNQINELLDEIENPA